MRNLSDREKIMPHGNPDLHKGMKVLGNVVTTWINIKPFFYYYLSLFKRKVTVKIKNNMKVLWDL